MADLIAGLHAQSHRWPLNWQDVEPAAPVGGVHNYDFTTYDRMYQADLARGIRPLILVTNAPSWAWAPDVPRLGQGWGFPPGPDHLGDWKAFCAEVAKRYPQAAGLEIWNEPNNPTFWGMGMPQEMPNADYYATLLANAYDGIKAQDSSMTVVGGALAPFGVGDAPGRIPMTQYLRTMLQDGAAAHMDALSIHTYAGNPTLTGPALFTWAIDEARATEAEAGAKLPLWLTEVGITTTGPDAVSAQKQADSLVQFVLWARKQPDIGAYYIHTMIEPTSNEADPEKGFALTTGASFPFSPKPAYYALQRVASGGDVNLTVDAPRHQPIAQTRVLTVRAKCGTRCRVKATGHIRVHHAGKGDPSFQLRPVSTNLKRMAKGTLRLGIGGRALRAIRGSLRHGRLRASGEIAVVARNRHGDSMAKGVLVTLRS